METSTLFRLKAKDLFRAIGIGPCHMDSLRAYEYTGLIRCAEWTYCAGCCGFSDKEGPYEQATGISVYIYIYMI